MHSFHYAINWFIDWLGFNITFSTIRLYRAYKNYSLVKSLKILRFGECNNMCEGWQLGKYSFRWVSEYSLTPPPDTVQVISEAEIVSDYVHTCIWCKYIKRARLLERIYSVHA